MLTTVTLHLGAACTLEPGEGVTVPWSSDSGLAAIVIVPSGGSTIAAYCGGGQTYLLTATLTSLES